MNKGKVSLIISVYNDIEALGLILKSISLQTFAGKLEVIIEEDKQCVNLQDQVGKWRQQYIYPIKHINQADLGFRKCKILNQAIRVVASGYIIFIDGDCVLHKNFVEAHLSHSKPGAVVYGRRVMLSSYLSNKVLQKQQFFWFKYFFLLVSGCKRLDAAWYLPFSKPEEKIGFWGHNWSIHLKDLKQVGGFDEAYEQAGIGEDTDIEWRLQMRGIRFYRIKNKAIQYHLYHPSNYSNTLAVEKILADKKQAYLAGNQSVLLGSL
jgi:glycosyltransferase involved in cell wall biosynthesis